MPNNPFWLTEEIYLGDRLQGWRRYRFEYGFECGCPEGVIYLPENFDTEIVEKTLREWLKDWQCKCHDQLSKEEV